MLPSGGLGVAVELPQSLDIEGAVQEVRRRLRRPDFRTHGAAMAGASVTEVWRVVGRAFGPLGCETCCHDAP